MKKLLHTKIQSNIITKHNKIKRTNKAIIKNNIKETINNGPTNTKHNTYRYEINIKYISILMNKINDSLTNTKNTCVNNISQFPLKEKNKENN